MKVFWLEMDSLSYLSGCWPALLPKEIRLISGYDQLSQPAPWMQEGGRRINHIDCLLRSVHWFTWPKQKLFVLDLLAENDFLSSTLKSGWSFYSILQFSQQRFFKSPFTKCSTPNFLKLTHSNTKSVWNEVWSLSQHHNIEYVQTK